MLLKLVMPHFNRMVRGGTITKWFKSEGEWISYGDDLCDARVEIERRVFINPDLSAKIRRLTEAVPAREEDFSMVEKSQRPKFFVRITSSDAGVLHRVHTEEGGQVAVGDLLAILTTDRQPPVDETPQAVMQAGEFRVVVNVVEPC